MINKVVQDAGPVLGVQHFRMELGAVKAAGLVLRSGHRAVGRMGNDLKPRSCLLDIIIVTHPADILVGQTIKQRAGGIQVHQRFAVFPLGSLGHTAAQLVHHQLAAVANPQNRHAPGIHGGINGGRIRQISAVGPTGKNDPLRVFGLDLCKISAIGINFAIHVALADAACDQLVILTAKIQNNDSFLLHGSAPFP